MPRRQQSSHLIQVIQTVEKYKIFTLPHPATFTEQHVCCVYKLQPQMMGNSLQQTKHRVLHLVYSMPLLLRTRKIYYPADTRTDCLAAAVWHDKK